MTPSYSVQASHFVGDNHSMYDLSSEEGEGWQNQDFKRDK